MRRLRWNLCKEVKEKEAVLKAAFASLASLETKGVEIYVRRIKETGLRGEYAPPEVWAGYLYLG